MSLLSAARPMPTGASWAASIRNPSRSTIGDKAAASSSARADDFYPGKTVTLFASQPLGGGIDTEMRLVARFLGKFIPGEPSILPMNMCRLSAARLCARQLAGKRGAIVPA
jgi:hypothetical protein